jgi:hypothetical protein
MEKYIQKGIAGVVEMPADQNPASLDAGESYQDWQSGRWIRLTAAQAAFAEAHPGATAKEIIEMQPAPPPVRTQEQAKAEKLAAIEAYNSSAAVDTFYIQTGEATVPFWIPVDARGKYRLGIDALKGAGRPVIEFNLLGNFVALPIDAADGMLKAVEEYAYDSATVTDKHRTAVNALETVEAVDGYDHTAGYPEKLIFNIE